MIQFFRPFVYLVIIIKPVLFDQRNDLVLHNATDPFIIYIRFIFGCKIAMTDLEALTERAVLADRIVQFSDLSNHRMIQLALNIRLIITKPVLIGVFKSRLHRIEAETSAECIVDHGKASVCGIHHADDMQIFGNIESRSTVNEV